MSATAHTQGKPAPAKSKDERNKAKSGKEEEEDKVKLVGPFGQRIELPVVKPTKHKCPLYPDGFLAFEIIGTSGCGKNRLMLSILPNIGGLNSVVFCTLVPGNDVYKRLQRWCEQEGAHFALAYTIDDAADAIEYACNDIEYGEDESGIIIFDDFSGQQDS